MIKTKSVLEVMRDDIRRALKKPPEKRRWGMIVDIRKCIGCHACSVACKAENKTPEGVDYRTVKEVEDGEFPNVQRFFMPGLCMQCDNPPCVKACKDGSMSKSKDGIILIDYKKNSGDPNVAKACPYGVLSVDKGNYYTDGTPKREKYEDIDTFEYSDKSGRTAKVGKNRKCHYCIHRVNAGMLPACVTTCIGEANYFGDLNDPNSVVSKKAKEKGLYIFQGELGTKPKTNYLGADTYDCAKCHE